MENQIESHKGYNFTFHPKNVVLVLLLFSLSMLFVALSVAYVYSRFQSDLPPVKIPLIFIFNTLVLLAGSYSMYLAKKAYRDDDTISYQRRLTITLFLSVLFLLLQFVGWYQLFQENVAIKSSLSASYLYLLSFLHFAHVIGGIPFLIKFLFVAYKRMKEPVSVLVYFSDPEKRLGLRLLTMYWNFLDILWIYLVLFFLLHGFL